MIKFAYLGPRGSFTYQAAKLFCADLSGPSSTSLTDNSEDSLIARANLRDIFSAVKNSECEYGVIPIDNNIEGYVSESLDLLKEFSNLQVLQMLEVEIKFDAVKLKGDNSMLTTITAHPHALAQCRKFIETNNLLQLPAVSNSLAAKNLQSGQLALVPHNSEFENTAVHHEFVQNYQNARTKFVLIGQKNAVQSNSYSNIAHNSNITHNLCAITPLKADEPGTLLNILQIFQNQGINISTLISRPHIDPRNQAVDNLNHYTFFAVLDTDFTTCQKLLKEVEQAGNFVQNLGGW